MQNRYKPYAVRLSGWDTFFPQLPVSLKTARNMTDPLYKEILTLLYCLIMIFLTNSIQRVIMSKRNYEFSDKVAVSAVLSVSAKRRMQKAGNGNFTKGVEVCAKSFAPFARGTENFNAAQSIFMDSLQGKSISDCAALWLERGYWLPNLLCFLSQEFSEGNLTISSDLIINLPIDKK
jgi:hypothetical protein